MLNPCAVAAPAGFGAAVWSGLGALAFASACETAGVSDAAVWSAFRATGEALPCAKCRRHFLDRPGWGDGDPLDFLVAARNASVAGAAAPLSKEAFLSKYVAPRASWARVAVVAAAAALLAAALASALRAPHSDDE